MYNINIDKERKYKREKFKQNVFTCYLRKRRSRRSIVSRDSRGSQRHYSFSERERERVGIWKKEKEKEKGIKEKMIFILIHTHSFHE